MTYPLDSLAVEVEFVDGVWTDVTGSVVGGVVELHYGREGDGDPTLTVSPGTCGFALWNTPDAAGVAPFMPGNPMSPYGPNCVPRKRVRVTATRSGVDYTRFAGWTEEFAPSTESGSVAAQTVAVTCSDVLGQYARRDMRSEWTERALQSADTDVHPFDESSDAVTVRNLAVGGVDGRAVASKLGQGTLQFGDPDGPLVDGVASFARDPGVGTCPVLLLPLQDDDVYTVNFWARATEQPGGFDDIVCGWDAAGNNTFRFGAYDNAGAQEWQIRDVDDNVISESAVGGDLNKWRGVYILAFDSGGGAYAVEFFLDAVLGYGAYSLLDIRSTRWLSVGGNCSPKTPGYNRNTFVGSVSGIITGRGAAHADRSLWATPTHVRTAANFVTDLVSYGGTNPYGATVATGDFTREITAAPTAGTTLLDMWELLARTIGGTVAGRPDGVLEITGPDAARPTTPALTLDVEQDLATEAGEIRWSDASKAKPTSVTASANVGSVTVQLPDVPASARRDVQVQTIAATVDGARDVASALLNAAGGLRLASVTVDLSTAAHDLWADAYSVRVGSRLRVQGMPVGWHGVTQVDAYVAGWTETYDAEGVSCLITYDCDAIVEEAVADTSPAAWGDGVATVSGGTAVGSTGNGTLVIDRSAGPTLTLDPAAYPLGLDWAGEQVTIGSPPGSAVSPQTVTTTARGVSPTGARAHAADEPVEVWDAARAAR